MNENRSHIDELGRDIHIQFAQLFDIGQVLRCDSPHGDIVDINVLLTNQMKQQVKRSFVDIAHGDGKRKVALLFPGLFFATRRRTRRKRGPDIERRPAIESDLCFLLHRVTVSGSYFAAWEARGTSYSSDMPMTSRTSFMVAVATRTARFEPASRISQASRGFSSYLLRRSCMG